MVILDVRGLSAVADLLLVATGNNGPHLKALTQAVEEALSAAGSGKFRRSGTPDSGWIVSDHLDVVVHLFTREKRAYYALEALWNDAPRL